jgi:hypothetical protein
VFFYLFITLLFPGLQTSTYGVFPGSLAETLQVKADYITADALGNIYIIDKQGLTKYNPGSSKMLSYSNPGLGPVDFVDATDPLNILVFHSHAGILQVLDKNLSTKPVNAQPPQWWQSSPPSLLAASSREGFWAFFQHTMSLRLIDWRYRQLQANENIRQQVPTIQLPIFIIEANNQLWILDERKNIYLFDNFANFSGFITSIDATEFQVVGNNIIYFPEGEMRIFNFVSNSEAVYLLPEHNVMKGIFQGQQLILHTPEAIYRYSFTENIF